MKHLDIHQAVFHYILRTKELSAAGDALFNGSIGRTDLPGANHEQLLKSIHDKLLTLPEKTFVLCGHKQVTTIGKETDQILSNGF